MFLISAHTSYDGSEVNGFKKPPKQPKSKRIDNNNESGVEDNKAVILNSEYIYEIEDRLEKQLE
jgi:hypothetical protein